MAIDIGTQILGTGSYVPETVLSNEFFAANGPYRNCVGVDENEEILWETKDGKTVEKKYSARAIEKKVGIRERRRAANDETTLDIATRAAQCALRNSDLNAGRLDAIIVASVTQDRPTPSLACELQRQLAADNVSYAHDLSAGCAGSIFACNIADMLIRFRGHRHVLIIGVERLSKIVDYRERDCILFGDAGSALVLGRGNDPYCGFLSFQTYSDACGGQTKWLFVDNKLKLRMPQGSDIRTLAIGRMIQAIQSVITQEAQKMNLTYDQMKELIVAYCPHQANIEILNPIGAEVGANKVVVIIDRFGNTSSASCLMSLDIARREGRIKKDDYFVVISFGAGLVTAALIGRL